MTEIIETLEQKRARLAAELAAAEKELGAARGEALNVMSISLPDMLSFFEPFFAPSFRWPNDYKAGDEKFYRQIYDYLNGKVPGAEHYFARNMGGGSGNRTEYSA
ncbi:MAG: hypothetical protein LBG89_03265 [Rickettsiales bacterium]|jgi:hypothetical protein|nr:hypothetical protein [Rickettsiales bacterium]